MPPPPKFGVFRPRPAVAPAPAKKTVFDDDGESSDDGSKGETETQQDTKRQKFSFLSSLTAASTVPPASSATSSTTSAPTGSSTLSSTSIHNPHVQLFANLVFDEPTTDSVIETIAQPIEPPALSVTLSTNIEHENTDTISFEQLLQEEEKSKLLSHLFTTTPAAPFSNSNAQDDLGTIPDMTALLDQAAQFDKGFLASSYNATSSQLNSLTTLSDIDTIEHIVDQSIQTSSKKRLVDVKADGQVKSVVQSSEQAKIDHANALIATVNMINQLLTYVDFPPHLHDIFTPHQSITAMAPDIVKLARFRDNILIKPSLGVSPYADICKPLSSWDYCGFSAKMLKCLRAHRYQAPFPVQQHVLPLVMSGNDVLCCASTGSGKTLAFVLPMIRYVISNKYSVDYRGQAYHWEKSTFPLSFDQNGHQIIPEPVIYADGTFDPIPGYPGSMFNSDQYLKWVKQRQKQAKTRVLIGNHFSEFHQQHLYLSRQTYNQYSTTVSLNSGSSPHALILVPTRELALQIQSEVKKFSDHLRADKMSINVLACFGGRPLSQDIGLIKNFDDTAGVSAGADAGAGAGENTEDENKTVQTVDVLVATPGRLIELLGEDNGKNLNLLNVGYFVIDEADRMFDLGFEFQLDLILKALPSTVITKHTLTKPQADQNDQASSMNDGEHNSITANSASTQTTEIVHSRRQTLLFSATFPPTIERIARKIMTKPMEIHVNNNKVNASIIQAYIASYDDEPHRSYFHVPQPLDIPLRSVVPPTTITANTSTPIPPPLPLSKLPINVVHPNLLATNPIPSLSPTNEYRFYQLATLLCYWATNQLDVWFYYYYAQIFSSYPGVQITPQVNPTNPDHVQSYKVTYTPPLDLLVKQHADTGVAGSLNQASSTATINNPTKSTPVPTTTQTIDITNHFMSILRNLPIFKDRGKVIIFVESKSQVDNLVLALQKHNFQCLHVHGDQPQEDRDDYLHQFKTMGCAPQWESNFNQLNAPESLASLAASAPSAATGETSYQQTLRCPTKLWSQNQNGKADLNTTNPLHHCDILVTTSILSRGIDVPSLSLVVNYDCSTNYGDHIHRVGRTGRGENSGFAVTFLPYDPTPPHLLQILQDEQELRSKARMYGQDEEDWKNVLDPLSGKRIETSLERFDLSLFLNDATPEEKRYLRNQAAIYGIVNHIAKENYRLEQITEGVVVPGKKKTKKGKKDEHGGEQNDQNDQNDQNNHPTTTSQKSTTMGQNDLKNSNTDNDAHRALIERLTKYHFSDFALINAPPFALPGTSGYVHFPKTIMIAYCLARFQVQHGLVHYDSLGAYKSTTKGPSGDKLQTGQKHSGLANAALRVSKKAPKASGTKTGKDGDDGQQASLTSEEKRRLELRQKVLALEEEERRAELAKKNAAAGISDTASAPGSNALIVSGSSSNQLVDYGANMKGFKSAGGQGDQEVLEAMRKLNRFAATAAHAAQLPVATLETHQYSSISKGGLLIKGKLTGWMDQFNVLIEKRGDAQFGNDHLIIHAKPSNNPNYHTDEDKHRDQRNNVEACKAAIIRALDEKKREEYNAKQVRNLMKHK